MPFTRAAFGIFFSASLDAVDRANLAASHVTLVQLTSGVADDVALLQLHQAGVRRIVVRLDVSDTATPAARHRTAARVSHMAALGVGVDTIVLGNEPDNAYDLTWASPSWHQDRAFDHQYAISEMLDLLAGMPVKTVSPAFTMRSISEDDPPQPGQLAWREICEPAYGRCDLAGWHQYGYGLSSMVDWLRLKFALKLGQSLWHKPLYLDELGINTGTPLQRMQAYIDIARWLETNPLGARVEALVPFVSSGNGVGWDRGYLLRDPAAYALLGQFTRREI